MKKHSLRFLTLTLIGILICSCQNDDDFFNENQGNKNELSTFNDIVLGKKLENPYSVTNMKKALNNLKTSSKKSAKSTDNFNINVETTHLYIKFIPKNEEELAILKKDSTLILYSYPLDYEIVEGTGYYRDPEVPEGQPTYQYCAIKVNKMLPQEVESEILEELFIPDEDSDDASKSRKKQFSTQDVNSLVDESLKITNNLKETQNNSKLFARRSKWRPAGTIRVWDENIGTTTSTRRIFSHWEYYNCQTGEILRNCNSGTGGPLPLAEFELKPEEDNCCKRAIYTYTTTTTDGSYVGVEGVKVRARRWFTTHRGIANSSGYYSCDGRFRRPANYSIDWERYEFALRDGWLNGATYNGPKITGNWNLNLRGDKQAYYATIFRAAHHYYYKDIKGLRRPPQNSFWRTQMKIRAYLENVSNEGSLGAHAAGWRAFGLYSPIKMYTYQRPAIETYATTIHELAHASHWHMDRSDFSDTETKVKESWARGVQWELTRMTYPDYLSREFRRDDYTLVVSDMIDDDFETEEDTTNKGYYESPNDQVSGYTIRQIEDALLHQKTWNSWRDNIISKYTNPTEEHLTRLFSAYE
ncbi:MAG: hypothetical protein COB60_07870 [Flavobacteriaceae bacterium]|nr:MAG: hypothetical protein COB60_07870 [Flavobacteriaceae bacterium]